MKQRYFKMGAFSVVCISLAGCLEQPVYYVSPYNGNNTSYHAMPLKKDSATTATYASGSLYWGSANTNLNDKVFQASGNVYQTRQFGIFEAYYGLGLSAGSYKVAPFDTAHFYTTRDFQTLNKMAGNKSVADVHADGGINLVHVTRHGEWRVIGTEFSLHNEMGSYLSFRNHLPDSAANLIIRNSSFATLGFTTESVRKTKHGSYSFKFAYGVPIGAAYNHAHPTLEGFRSDTRIYYNYSTLTFQYTYSKWTGYVQQTSAAYTNGWHVGAVYHLR